MAQQIAAKVYINSISRGVGAPTKSRKLLGISSMYYLYLKTHNETGLKYLGQTSQDPLKYRGSGNRWINHIKKHGNNVNTQVILQTNDVDDLRDTGLFFSKLWNIVESNDFANLIIESGIGTPSGKYHRLYDKQRSLKTKRLISKAQLGKLNHNYGKIGILNHQSKALYVNGKLFNSLSEASTKLNIHQSTLSHRLRSEELAWKFYHYR